MTPTKDQDGPASGDITDEINKAMAEAEAAVDATRRGTGDFQAIEDEEDGDAAIEVQSPESQIEALRAEVAATKDKWLRAVADHDNFRKRVKRDIDDAVMRKTQALLSSFLPTVDNLDRALEIAATTRSEQGGEHDGAVGQVVKGLQMVRDDFWGALRKHGIEAVDSVGLPFDPAMHDALQQIDSPDHPPGVVIREFEKGYKLGDRLLRPARVIVAGAGSSGAES